MAVFPWYHGSLGRDDADSRLRDVCHGLPGNTVVFLVRDKSGSDRDLVLSWMVAQKQVVTHFVIKMMGAGDNKTYFLDAQIEGKTSYFTNVGELIDHFKTPVANFPGGPLAFGCPSPLALIVREPEAMPAPPPERGAGPALGSATINPDFNRRASERTLERQLADTPIGQAGPPLPFRASTDGSLLPGQTPALPDRASGPLPPPGTLPNGNVKKKGSCSIM